MLLDAFRLLRSTERPATAGTFGYTDTVGYSWRDVLHDGVGSRGRAGATMRWDNTLVVGAPIALPDPHALLQVTPPLFKTVELQVRGDQKAVVIERFSQMLTTGLLPFRVRYRMDDGGVHGVVYTRNLATAHSPYAPPGAPTEMYDPRQQFLTSLEDTGQLSDASAERLFALTAAIAETPAFDYLARSDLSTEALKTDVQHLMRYLSWRTSGLSLVEQTLHPGMIVGSILLPPLPVYDTLLARYPEGVLDVRDVRRNTTSALVRLDTTPPHLLQTHAPETTLYSPAAYASVAALLDDLAATDLDVGYILSNGSVVDRHVTHLVDRYAHILRPNAPRDFALLDQIAQRTVQIWADECLNLAPDPYAWMTDHMDLRVFIRKTYADEAMVEIYPNDAGPNDDDQPLVCVHFDLPALHLCSLGVVSSLHG